MSVIDEIKQKNPLIEYARTIYGTGIKRVGSGTYRLKTCPFCNSTKGFTFYDDSDNFHCFACGQSGGVLDLYMHLQHCDLKQAIADLAKQSGISYQAAGPRQISIKEKARDYYHDVLMGNSKTAVIARDYIENKRKIDIDTVKAEKIGLADGRLVDYLRKEGYSDEEIERAGMASVSKDKKRLFDYWGTDVLLFPHHCGGDVSHFSQKPIKDNSGKPIKDVSYQSKKEHRNPECYFYGQDVMLQSPSIVYVEGEFDRLSIISRAGFKSVVCINGSLSGEQVEYANRPEFRHKEHVLLFDNDEAGARYNAQFIKHGNFAKWKIRKAEVSKKYKDIDAQLSVAVSPRQSFAVILAEAERFADDTFRVETEGGFYSVWRSGPKDKDSGMRKQYLERVCNFTIELRKRYILPQGMHREVVLINEYGEESRPFILSPEQMGSQQSFKNTCLGLGNFVWEGRDGDLTTIWQHLFSRESGAPIYEEETVGFLPQHHLWLFGNCAVQGTSVIETDEDGIAWGIGKGWRASVGRVVTAGDQDERIMYLPTLSPLEGIDPQDWTGCNEWLDKLLENTGTYGSWLCAGWFLSCVFAREIFKKYKSFPLLFLYGRAQCGKNTLARLLAASWGLSDADFILLSEATQTGISRRLAYYSEMPVIIDEYRNDMKGRSFDGFFRGIYNRTGAVKAERDGSINIRQVAVRGMVCLLGEHQPGDMALRQRCLVVRLVQNSRRDDLLPELERGSQYLSGYLLRLLKEKSLRVDKIMKDVKTLIKHGQTAHGHDARTALNYAIPTAVICSILGDGPRKDDFLDWVGKASIDDYEEKSQESVIGKFIDDCLVLKHTGMLNEETFLYEQPTDQEKAEYGEKFDGWGWLYMNNAYSKWNEYLVRQREIQWQKRSLVDQIKEEPWYVESKNKRWPMSAKGDSETKFAMKIKIQEGVCPQNVALLFTGGLKWFKYELSRTPPGFGKSGKSGNKKSADGGADE